MVEDCVYEELEDSKTNDLIEKNEAEVHYEEAYVSTENENKDVIHRHMNLNKT